MYILHKKYMQKNFILCIVAQQIKNFVFSIDKLNLLVPLYILYNFFIFFYPIFTKIKKNIAQKNCIIFVQFYIILSQWG